MNPISTRFMHAYHEVDPRDRRNGLWVVSPDVYESLMRENPQVAFPLPELVRIDRDPDRAREVVGAAEISPATALGIPINVDPELPAGTLTLDIDDAVTRAVKRGRERGILINIVKVEPIPFVMPPPPPEVTLRALVRKWIKRGRS